MRCFFVSDLHGKINRYEKLFSLIQEEKPGVVLLGGDLLPHFFSSGNFLLDYLYPEFSRLRENLGDRYPEIFLIFGNDDAKSDEQHIYQLEESGLCRYLHLNEIEFDGIKFIGYSYTPPSPFLLKDWEKYDVSRYVEPGCISPEHGKRTVEISEHEKKYSTIKNDLKELANQKDFGKTVFLFHCPPYNTNLDHAGLDGKKIDNVQLDVHVGSVAIRKFIEDKQPLITLHGHIHESARLTGSWHDKIGNTFCLSAAYDGPQLALVKFDTNAPQHAERILENV